MLKSRWWLALSIAYVALAVASVFPVMMSAMLFDAPGSEENGKLWALAGSVLCLPLSFLLGAVLPWAFRKTPYAWKLFFLPVLNLTVTVVLSVVAFD